MQGSGHHQHLAAHKQGEKQLSQALRRRVSLNPAFGLRLCLIVTIILGLLKFCQNVFGDGFTFSAVSREVVETRLGKYKGNNKQRELTLKQMFADAGCDSQNLSEQPVKESKLPNVICSLPGSSGRTIIVAAHFDRVSEGDGVVDNWSGASLLPSLYEAVQARPRKHTYIFIGFTDEEKGEVGSHFYVQHMTRDDVAATDAMVNMDTLGLGPTAVWASHADKQLTKLLAYLAQQLKLPVSAVNVEEVGSTDSEQFAGRKIPSITIHSLTQETWNARILHTSKDKFSAMRLEDYYETYRLVAAYITYLDQVLPLSTEKRH